ncbi:MAG: hypothetical protein KF830_02320 [Planctomycetes bacterium]|nr:hypothetical protein [Planctomycetota bacterium]
MTARLPLAAIGLLFAAACATPVATGRPDHVLETELRRLQALQQVFREQNTTPIEFDFPADGRVTVREVSLDGWPGSAYVRCRFHYQNRTDKPLVQAWVALDVLDAEGRVVSSQACNCIIPVPMAIARGSYYSDELRTPTYDAHLQPGWSWRIRCTAIREVDEEPLDPPAPERLRREYPPMQIKDRSWRPGDLPR